MIWSLWGISLIQTMAAVLMILSIVCIRGAYKALEAKRDKLFVYAAVALSLVCLFWSIHASYDVAKETMKIMEASK